MMVCYKSRSKTRGLELEERIKSENCLTYSMVVLSAEFLGKYCVHWQLRQKDGVVNKTVGKKICKIY